MAAAIRAQLSSLAHHWPKWRESKRALVCTAVAIVAGAVPLACSSPYRTLYTTPTAFCLAAALVGAIGGRLSSARVLAAFVACALTLAVVHLHFFARTVHDARYGPDLRRRCADAPEPSCSARLALAEGAIAARVAVCCTLGLVVMLWFGAAHFGRLLRARLIGVAVVERHAQYVEMMML